MSNRFYNFVNQLISGSVAKASEVNAELQGAEVGFSTVESELNTAIKLPSTESLTDQRITESPASRIGKLIGFDESGALKVTSEFDADWSMGGHRLRNVIDAVDGDEPVNLSQMSAYSAGLAGLPSISGRLGHLTTDGATISWSGAGRMVPETTTIGDGLALIYSSGECKWLPVNQNAAFDPNGVLGSSYWTTSLIRFANVDGNMWTNSGVLSGSTFTHEPAVSGRIGAGAGKTLTGSVEVYTVGVSAGTINLMFRFYDSGGGLLSTATGDTVSNGATYKVYATSVTCPASTAYVTFGLSFSAVSSSAYGIIVKNLKVESGLYATPFRDDKTVALAYGASTQTYWGSGYTTPIVTIGDATATTSQLDFRSAAGAQTHDARIQCSAGTSGSDDKGVLTLKAQRIVATGPIGATAEYDAGNSGAGLTIDFAANGQYQKVTLTSATPTITIATTSLAVGKYQLRVIQDGAGGRAPTWSGFVAANCVANSFPSVAAAIAGVTFVNLYWDGSAFWVSSNPWD